MSISGTVGTIYRLLIFVCSCMDIIDRDTDHHIMTDISIIYIQLEIDLIIYDYHLYDARDYRMVLFFEETCWSIYR